MGENILTIEGMTCMHCKMRVEKALKEVPGVTGVEVDLGAKQAKVAGTADKAALTQAVQGAGYKVVD